MCNRLGGAGNISYVQESVPLRAVIRRGKLSRYASLQNTFHGSVGLAQLYHQRLGHVL